MKNAMLFLALIVLGSVWGLTVPLSLIVVSTGYSPLGVIFWQSLFATLMLGSVVLIRGKSIERSRRMAWHFLFMGLVGSFLPGLTYYIGATVLPGGFLAIIVAAAPMFSLLMALALSLEKFSWLRMAGVVLGAVAIALLMAPDSSLPDWKYIPFVFIALLTPLFYAAEAIYLSTKAPPGVDPVVTLLGASVVSMLVSGPIAWFSGNGVDLLIPWTKVEWALLFMSAISAVAYVGYVTLVGVAGAVFAIQTAYVVTIAGVFFSAMILDESYTGWVWLALGLMLAGLMLVRPTQKSS